MEENEIYTSAARTYEPIEIEIIEVTMEKGYAISVSNFENGGSAW